MNKMSVDDLGKEWSGDSKEIKDKLAELIKMTINKAVNDVSWII